MKNRPSKPSQHRRQRMPFAIGCVAFLILMAPLASADPCSTVGGCPIPVPEPTLPVYTIVATAENVVNQAGLFSATNGNGGPCTFETAESNGLRYIQAFQPYGSAGWSSNGDNISQTIHICETKKVDAQGYKHVYWAFFDTINARNGWHVKDTGDCDRCGDPYAEVLHVKTTSDQAFQGSDPVNEASSNCSTATEFSLSASAFGIEAGLSWSESVCQFREVQDYGGSGEELRWHAEVAEGRSSWTFTYGFITKARAGTPATVTVHHEAQVCNYDCLFGQWTVYMGDYTAVVQTTEEGLSTPSNGDFESGGSCPPTNWQYYEYNSGTACTVSAPTHRGSGAVKIHDPGTSVAAGIASKCVPASAGQSVTVSAWYSGGNPPSSSAVFSLYLEFFDYSSPGGSGTRIGVAYTGGPTSSQDWNQLAVSDVAPSGTVCARALLYSHGGSSGTFYVDDVDLTVNG